jgi:hypothetical protein
MPGRIGVTNKSQQRTIGVIEGQVRQVVQVGRMSPTPVSQPSVTSNLMTRGAQVSFQVQSIQAVDSFVLLRNFSRDSGSAQVIHTWPASALKATPQSYPISLHYADADPAIAGKIAYYWIKAVPVSNATNSNVYLSDPQEFDASDQPSALQITGDYPICQAYTPTTQPLTAVTGSGANQATIDVAAFQIQYPFSLDGLDDGDLVSYNSGSITPLLDNTLYFVYFNDPTYAGGAQTYVASVNNPDVTAGLYRQYLGSITTPAHGGGSTGGSGGGGGVGGPPCFTGGTRIITKAGLKRIADILAGYDEVLTQRGWRKVVEVIAHRYDGPLCDMGGDEGVTPTHRFWHRSDWMRAEAVFVARPVFSFRGRVLNLCIRGDGSDEEQCFTLANGWIAHNMRKF